MAGFEPRTSGVRSTGSARRAAITDCQLVGLLPGGEFKILSLKEEIWFELRATWTVVTHIKVPKGSFTLAAVVCRFRSGLRQRRDRNFSISVEQHNHLLQTHAECE